MTAKIAIVFVFVTTSIAQAQWIDADGNPVTDIGPVFKYYSIDSDEVDQYGNAIDAGSFTVVNSGPNGVVDSVDNSIRMGDDFGLISLVVSMPSDLGVASVLPPFVDGIAWGSANYSNGAIRLDGDPISALFLPINEVETVLFKLPGGLGAEAFIDPVSGFAEIETVNMDSPGQPHRTLFSNCASSPEQFTFCVPEPSSFGLFCANLLVGMRVRRRR